MKLTRKKQEIFAVNAPLNDTTVYGTAKDGSSAVYSQDIAVLQGGLWKQGIKPSLLGNFAPFVEDSTGAFRVFSEQLAYLMQNGIPEWNSSTNYYANVSFVQIDGQLFQSLTGTDSTPNLGNNPLTDFVNWKRANFGSGGGFVLLNGYTFNMELTGDDALGWALSGSIVSGQNAVESMPVLTQAYTDGVSYGTGTIYSTITDLKRATTLKKGLLIAPYTTENVNALNSLWNAGKEANVWLLDTVNQRFMCPRTRNWTANTTGIEDFIEASLPNVIAEANLMGSSAWESKGSFYGSNIIKGSRVGGFEYNGPSVLNFNANRSSPTYKNGATVQQNASTVYVYYRIYDAIKPSEDIRIEDLTQILTDLQSLENAKLDKDLSNLPQVSKEAISGFGFPSDRWDDLVLGSNDSKYIAPADGWFVFGCISSVANSVRGLSCAHGLEIMQRVQGSGYFASVYIGVSKGQEVFVRYDPVATSVKFYFIYAQGEK